MLEEANRIAREADLSASIRQLRRDMRYYRRVLNDHAKARLGATWHQTYHAKTECERRLHKRYSYDVMFRMKGIIIRLDRIEGHI